MFTKKDLEQFKEKGIQVKKINAELENFKTGFPFIELAKTVTLASGISAIDQKELNNYLKIYEENVKYGDKKVLKFVPASGAASRMFKELFNFIETYQGTNEEYLQFTANKKFNSVFNFFANIKDFAFYGNLKSLLLKNGIEIDTEIENKNFTKILKFLLEEQGLNYGSLPKGLLKFHKYSSYSRTAFEEHLVEGAKYCCGKNNEVNIHLTISENHKTLFHHHLNKTLEIFQEKHKVKYIISFSEQMPNTDTIAVDMANQPFRDEEGEIIFRPGGHGALIENINKIKADIIFMKNIDNISTERNLDNIVFYKKALAGILLKYQEEIFDYLKDLENPSNHTEKFTSTVVSFIENKLFLTIPQKMKNEKMKKKIQFLTEKLNRPIRVCGMVKNEGEPGGGPFRTINKDSTVSLQIVESSQINFEDDEQSNIAKNATHFNPVDLVLGVYNYKGTKFDLTKYIDTNMGFISKKTYKGKSLKAQELPGLWNGSMADWNTLFVEVPISTFNPVKTIFDLLRKEHKNSTEDQMKKE